MLTLALLLLIIMPIQAQASSKVKLNKTKITLLTGKAYQLKVKGTTSKVKWSSSNKSVATVKNGKVTAKKAGKTTITAKIGKKKLTCKVTVNQAVTSIKLNKTSLKLETGKSYTLKATVGPNKAKNKKVTWKTSNSKVAIVDAKGKVSTRTAGTAVITCEAKDGSGKYASCKIVVIGKATGGTTVTVKEADVKVTKISLNQTSLNLTVGESETLKATISPSNATNKTITWKSSDKKIATVDNSGNVKAIASGTASIEAQTSNGLVVSCTVTVKAKPTSYSLGEYTINGGDSFNIYYECETNPTLVKNITWKLVNVNTANANYIKKLKQFRSVSSGSDSMGSYSCLLFEGFLQGDYEVGAYNGSTLLGKALVHVTSNYAPFVAYENWKAQMKAKLWNDSMTVAEKLAAFANYSKKERIYGGSPNFYDYANLDYGLDCAAAADMMIDIADDLGLKGEAKYPGYGELTHKAAFIILPNGYEQLYDATPPKN